MAGWCATARPEEGLHIANHVGSSSTHRSRGSGRGGKTTAVTLNRATERGYRLWMHDIHELKAVLCTHTHTRAHWPGTRCVPSPPSPTLQDVLFPQGNDKETTHRPLLRYVMRSLQVLRVARTHSRPRQRRRRFSIAPENGDIKLERAGTRREQRASPHFLRRGAAADWKETRWAKFTFSNTNSIRQLFGRAPLSSHGVRL